MKLKSGTKKAIAIAPIVALMATTAWGHTVWLANRHDENVVVYGHGPSDDSYKPEQITEVKAYDANGTSLEIAPKEAIGSYVPLDIAEGTAVVTIDFDNGFWTVDKSGKWYNLPKTKVENARTAGHYVKNSLVILDHYNALPETYEIPLVIIPQSDPLKLHSGDELRIQVIYNGEPQAGVNVISDYVNQSSRISAVTDKEGFATITVRNEGLNVIYACWEGPIEGNPDADKLSNMASLTFTLKGSH